MRTDNKKTPVVILLYIIAVSLLAALVVAGRHAADASGHYYQLLAKPLSRDSASVDIWAVEDFYGDSSTLVTYEIRRQASAYAIRETHRMNVVGTNGAYANVMGYSIIDGGFFTKDAFLIGAREAVLNERAAATLFGGRRIAGNSFFLNDEPWTVVGIVSDEDVDNDNIYVPASSEIILAGAATVSAGALTALQDGYGGADASMTINKLKDLGVSENSYSFKNLGKIIASFGEMPSVALRFAFILLLCLFAWRFGRYAFRVYKSSRAENERKDLNDVQISIADAGVDERKRRASYVKAIVNILLFCVCTAAALVLARQIVEICITWQEIPLLLFETAASQDEFYGKLRALGERQSVVLYLFAASVIFSFASQASAVYLFKD